MFNKIYVLGNGPSLKELNFADLKTIDTVGMNAAYKYWYKINWFPTYYCCLDDVVVITHQDEIYKLITQNKIKKFFLHDKILEKYPSLRDNIKITFFTPEFNKDNLNIFYNNFVTTGSYSIRWMISLGYNYIGVLGIDCNYIEQIDGSKNINGLKMEISENINKNPNYFFDNYQEVGELYNIPNNPNCKVNHSVHLDSVNRIFSDCERLKIDVKIINTTFNNNLNFSNIMTIKNFINLNSKFDFNDSKCFNLLTTLYEGINSDRMDELFECLKNNYLNHYIKKIYIFFESQQCIDDIFKYIKINYNKVYNLIVKQKFEIIPIKTRPTYYDYFAFSESHLPNSKIIISNTDIYFDNSLDKIYDYDLTNKFFLLSRKFKSLDDNKLYLPKLGDVQYPWTKLELDKSISVGCYQKHNLFSNENYCGDMDWVVYDNGNTKIKYNDNLTIQIEENEYSKYYKNKPDNIKTAGKVTFTKLKEKINIRNEFTQDTWIFTTPFSHYKNIDCNIDLGSYKCDTLIACNFIRYCTKNSILNLSNPCMSINCIHVDNINKSKKDVYDKYKEKIPNDIIEEMKSSYIPWCEL